MNSLLNSPTDLNSSLPLYMHIDLNACFASIEQLANPFLRNKPVAVGARQSPNGCLVAVSYEAKAYGIKTGTRVREALQLCPHLIICEPDSDKYRAVHRQFKQILQTYSPDLTPKSIDEFVLNFHPVSHLLDKSLTRIAKEIKHQLYTQIGPPIRASVGIGPNRFLAKLAAGLQKPDGLTVINSGNLNSKLESLNLTDLPGIAQAMQIRLNRWDIRTPLEFLHAPSRLLEKQVFGSINGYYWYLRLRGWEIDDVPTQTRTIGHSYVLHRPSRYDQELLPILLKLTARVSNRLRHQGYTTRHLHLQIRYQKPYFPSSFRGGLGWGPPPSQIGTRGDFLETKEFKHGYLKSSFYLHQRLNQDLVHTHDLYKTWKQLFMKRDPRQIVIQIAITASSLSTANTHQLYLIPPSPTRWQQISESLETINDRYGEFTIYPARMHPAIIKHDAPDRIGFGRVKEL